MKKFLFKTTHLIKQMIDKRRFRTQKKDTKQIEFQLHYTKKKQQPHSRNIKKRGQYR